MHLRHVFISLVLLGIVLGISCFTQMYTVTVCLQTISAIEQIEAETDQAYGKLESIIVTFQGYAKALSYFHHHTYADTILTYLQRAKSYAAEGITSEMSTELEAVKSALETLRKRDALSLGNIL